MPAAEPERPEAPPGRSGVWYSYAVIRVVPRVERDEFVNVGVILFARTRGFLEARIELNGARLLALAPRIDLPRIHEHLAALRAVCAGAPKAGPIAALPPSERFHSLTAPRSTVIQTSPVHVGRCADPAVALDELLDVYVRAP